jgi:hypothetical protein
VVLLLFLLKVFTLDLSSFFSLESPSGSAVEAAHTFCDFESSMHSHLCLAPAILYFHILSWVPGMEQVSRSLAGRHSSPESFAMAAVDSIGIGRNTH